MRKDAVSLCCVAAAATLAAAQDSKAAVAARDAAFSAAFNSGDYVAVQEMYTPHAVLIPPPSVSWVLNTGSAIADFFKASATAGTKGIKLTPLFVKMEADPVTGLDVVTHEIGNATSAASPFGNMYYTRWVHNGTKWQIETDCMAVGKWWSDAGPKPNPPPVVPGSLPDFVERQTNALEKLLDTNTTTSLLKYVATFEDSALIVPPIPGLAGCPIGLPQCPKVGSPPPTGPCCPPAANPLAAFLTKPELFLFIETSAHTGTEGQGHKTIAATETHGPDGATIIHELGADFYMDARSPEQQWVSSYTRWTLTGKVAKVAVMVQNLGICEGGRQPGTELCKPS